MNKIEFLSLLAKYAKQYMQGALVSLVRNNHMNEITTEEIVQQHHIDAVLVDFINFAGMQQGVDYGLYSSDIKTIQD